MSKKLENVLMDLMGKKKKDMPFYIETEGQILSQLISQIISINVL